VIKSVSVTDNHFQPSLIFAGKAKNLHLGQSSKAGAYPSGASYEFPLKRSAPRITVINTLAYLRYGINYGRKKVLQVCRSGQIPLHHAMFQRICAERITFFHHFYS
jgi:hypothetical protein